MGRLYKCVLLMLYFCVVFNLILICSSVKTGFHWCLSNLRDCSTFDVDNLGLLLGKIHYDCRYLM